MSLTRPFPRSRGGLGLPTTASPLQSGWCWGVKLEPTFLGPSADGTVTMTVRRTRRRRVSKPEHTVVWRGSLAGGAGALGGGFG